MSTKLSSVYFILGLTLLTYSDPNIVGKTYPNKDAKIGIEFIDVSGELNKYVEYEIELLIDRMGFLEGPLWIDDYLLFTEPNRNNIWKYIPAENQIELWQSYTDIGGGCTALAYTTTYPDELWIGCHFAHKILHVNFTTHDIIKSYDHKTYNEYRDTKFEPNDIVIDKYGNVYFTDLPIQRKDEEGARGGVYHINRNTTKMQIIQLIGYGPNGIALNNDESLLVAANFIDVPIESFDMENYEQHDWDNMFIRGFKKSTGSDVFDKPFNYLETKNQPYYDYMLHDEYDMFFDSNGFDKYDNLWQTIYFNNQFEGGQISILKNDGDTPDDVKYIGTIRTTSARYAASNLEMGNDGYMYATCGDFSSDVGTLVRYKVKDVVDTKEEL